MLRLPTTILFIVTLFLGSVPPSLWADTHAWQPFIDLALSANTPKTFSEADKLFEKIYTSGTKLYSKTPRLAWALIRLAEFHRSKGRLKEAETRQVQAFQLLEKKLGSSHPLLVGPLNGLATIWFAQGHIAKARMSLEQGLAIIEKSSGPLHLLTIDTLKQLAKIYHLQGNPQKSLRMHRRIAEIHEHALRTDSPGEAIILARQAQRHYRAGQEDQAVPLFQQAINTLMNTSGPYHSARVEILTDLATIFQHQDNHEQSTELLKSALAISENIKGSDHPDLAPLLKQLAINYQKTGKPSQGRPLLLRAISLSENFHGQDHHETADFLLTLAENFRLENQPRSALPLYNRALAIFQRLEKPDNFGLVHSLTGLAKILQMQGKISLSERNHRQALILLVTMKSPQHMVMSAQKYHAELILDMRAKFQTLNPKTLTFFDKVRTVQERLTRLGIDPGPIDGLPGSKTLKALNTLEAQYGLPHSQKTTHLALDTILPHLPPPIEDKNP